MALIFSEILCHCLLINWLFKCLEHCTLVDEKLSNSSIDLTTNLDLSRLSSPGPGMEVCLFTLPPPVTLVLLPWLPSPSGSSSSIVPSNTSLRNLEVIIIINMKATISFPNVTLEKLWMTLGTYFPPVSWRRLCKCEGVNDGQCLCVSTSQVRRFARS